MTFPIVANGPWLLSDLIIDGDETWEIEEGA
jgi:hypothetical protein